MNRRIRGRRGRPARNVPVEVIRGLYGQGLSFRAIADATGIGYGTVRRAFHGLAPHGADTGETWPPKRKTRRKFKTAAAH